jgi:SulP family sulfate permease
MESKVSDHSALEALFGLVEKYQSLGKEIHIRHLSEDCQVLMVKASPKLADVIEKSIDDPRYHVMAQVMK